MLALIQGLIVGLTVAIPLGPAGLLCLERTIADGRWAGLSSGLGMALADTTFAFIAAFGLTILSDSISSHQPLIQGVGGIILLFVGLYMSLRHAKHTCPKPRTYRTALRASLTTYALTLTNPATILVILALFASMGVGISEGGVLSATFAVIGVFAGSLFWALSIAAGGSALRRHLHQRVGLIKRGTGVVMALIGAVALMALVF